MLFIEISSHSVMGILHKAVDYSLVVNSFLRDLSEEFILVSQS